MHASRVSFEAVAEASAAGVDARLRGRRRRQPLITPRIAGRAVAARSHPSGHEHRTSSDRHQRPPRGRQLRVGGGSRHHEYVLRPSKPDGPEPSPPPHEASQHARRRWRPGTVRENEGTEARRRLAPVASGGHRLLEVARCAERSRIPERAGAADEPVGRGLWARSRPSVEVGLELVTVAEKPFTSSSSSSAGRASLGLLQHHEIERHFGRRAPGPPVPRAAAAPARRSCARVAHAWGRRPRCSPAARAALRALTGFR